MKRRIPPVARRRAGRIFSCIAVAALLPGRSAAQVEPREPGVRMRVTTSSGVPVAGRLVSWRADSLVLEVAGSQQAFESQSLVRAEIFAGRRGQLWRGAKVGLLVGMAAGVVLGIAESHPPGWRPMSTANRALGGAIGYGVLGVGIGAVGGAMSRVDRWQRVAIPGATGPRDAHSRTRIGANVAF